MKRSCRIAARIAVAGAALAAQMAALYLQATPIRQGGLRLEAGASSRHDLKRGDVDRFSIRMERDQWAVVGIVPQQGRLFVTVVDPQSREIAKESRVSQAMPFPVWILATLPGDYQVRVESKSKDQEGGTYELSLQELRQAGPEDRMRFEAQGLYSRAEALRQRGTLQSRTESVEIYGQALEIWEQLEEKRRTADTLYGLGYSQYFLKGPRSALDYLKRELELRRSLGDRRRVVVTLNDIGVIHRSLGQYQEAMRLFEETLPLWQALGNPKGEANALTSQGWALEALGRPREAIARYERALELQQSVDDFPGQGLTLNNMGRAYQILGEMEAARDALFQALDARRETGDRTGEAATLNNIALLFQDQGEFSRALDYQEKALEIRREVGDRRGEATSLMNQAALFMRRGDLQLAIEGYKAAFDLFEATGEPLGAALTQRHLSSVYQQLGAEDRSLAALQRARELLENVGSDRALASIYRLQGRIELDRGQLDAALASTQKALELSQRSEDKSATFIALHQVGQVQQARGLPKQSLAFFERALELSRSSGNRLSEGLALKGSALAHASMDAPARAADLLSRSLKLLASVGDRAGQADALYHLARLERDSGKLASAQKMMDEALAIAESLRSQVETQELRSSYLASKRDYFDLQIDILMRLDAQQPGQGYRAAAFRLSEKARARGLLDMLAEAGIDIRKGVDPELLQQERRLQRQINAKERFRVRSAADARTQDVAAKAARELESLIREYRDLQGRLRSKSPRYAALTQAEPLNVEELRRQVLDEESVLLEYFLGEERSHLWVLSRDSLAHFGLPPAREIAEAARRTYELITSSHRRATKRAAERAIDDLSRMVLDAALGDLKGKRLIVAADGPLLYIPFAALTAPSAEGERPYLVEVHEIVTLPSASTLALQRRSRSPSNKTAGAVIFADPVFNGDDVRLAGAGTRAGSASVEAPGAEPSDLQRSARDLGLDSFQRLPHTRIEAEAIRSLAGPDRVSVALDFSASRDRVLNRDLSSYRFVHFATHGLLNDRHPELSGIVLSLIDEQGRPRNGFLRAHEIYNLDLSAQLVALSACSTALGKTVRGEGLQNLTRAFTYAGASSVLASLWDVRDNATAELMQQFYRSILQDGRTPADALRQAQRKMLENPRWRAPYYWAAFVLQGDWRPF